MGEDYYITNYPKSRSSSTEIIKADSEISFHIVSTQDSVQKIKTLDDKLTDSVKDAFEHIGLSEVRLFNYYLDKTYTNFPLEIWFKFKDEKEVYILYLESTLEEEPNGILSPLGEGELLWKNIKMKNNWYVCYRTHDINRFG